jgi:hypothetical protein
MSSREYPHLSMGQNIDSLRNKIFIRYLIPRAGCGWWYLNPRRDGAQRSAAERSIASLSKIRVRDTISRYRSDYISNYNGEWRNRILYDLRISYDRMALAWVWIIRYCTMAPAPRSCGGVCGGGSPIVSSTYRYRYRQLCRSQGSTLQILKVEPLPIGVYPEGGCAYRDHNAGRKTTLTNLEGRTLKILKVEPWGICLPNLPTDKKQVVWGRGIYAYPEGGCAYRDNNADRKTILANLEGRTLKILKVEPWDRLLWC